MSIFDRVFEDLVQRRDRISKGLLNCIPSPFPRFREVFPGIEKGKYLLFSANSKIGKTQIADDMCLYEPLFYAIEKDPNIRIKWLYFTWEMSAEQKYRQFLCHLLYRLSEGKIRVNTKQLRSIDRDRMLPSEILQLLQTPEYQKYIRYFEENVVFIEDVRNPTGIKKFLEEYAENNGIIHKAKKKFTSPKGDILEKEVFDYYEPSDPELYTIVLFDHISLVSTEMGMDVRSTIELLSNKILVRLRNRYGFTFVVIQQQAASQESNENFKLDKLRPTADGLGECKATFRDVDLFFGLYSPYRYKIAEYLGYDIKTFRDNIRFLELIGGREGGGGNVCPLYFDGAVNYFKELPRSNDEPNIAKVYSLLKSIRETKSILATIFSRNNFKLDTYGKSSWYFRIFRRWKNHKHNH